MLGLSILFNNLSPVKMPHGDLNFSLALSPGKALGLKGSNGIGKSTFVNHLKLNQDLYFKKSKIAFLDQFPLSPLGELSLKDLLQMFSDITNKPFDFNLIDRFDFKEQYDMPINSLSGGQNQVVKLIATFFLDPDIYILDEPLNNLDSDKVSVVSSLVQEKLKMMKSFLIIDHSNLFIDSYCDEIRTMVFKDKFNLVIE